MRSFSSEPDIQPAHSLVPSRAAGIDDLAPSFSANAELRCDCETILFVEDEAFVREGTGEVLRAAGYRVLMAGSAAEALRSYDQYSAGVDMLLTDVILPGQSGRDLAKQLRAQEARLKVLLITGYGKEMGLSNKEYPAEKCLAKPFSARILLEAIRELLGESAIGGAEAVRNHAWRR